MKKRDKDVEDAIAIFGENACDQIVEDFERAATRAIRDALTLAIKRQRKIDAGIARAAGAHEAAKVIERGRA